MCVKDEEESDEADDDSVDDKLDQYEEEITSISRTGTLFHNKLHRVTRLINQSIKGNQTFAIFLGSVLWSHFLIEISFV